MSRNSYPAVAREGWPFIATATAAAVVAYWLSADWSLLFAVIALAFVAMFRDPYREIPAEPLGVVSPVDGVVESVESHGDRVRIRVRIQRFGAYSGRAPVEGKVLDTPGERGMRIQTDEGDEVLLFINTAPAFARPKALHDYGDRVGQGERCAWLRLARIAEVCVPNGSRIAVEPGRHVLAGTDLLAELVH